MEFSIAEAILVHPLIVGCPVELQLLIRSENKTYLAAGLEALVILFVELRVINETLQSAIETCHSEGQLLAGTVVMGHLYIAIQTVTYTQQHIRTLIVHRVLGIDSHQSAFGILSIKRSLRASQDINTVEHIEVVVESRLRHQRDVVIINAHGRVVDARANTTHIHGRREARAVGRHHERGNILRQLTEVAHVKLLQLLTAKYAAAHRLEAQAHLLLGLGHDNYFVKVDYTGSVARGDINRSDVGHHLKSGNRH